MGWDSYGYFTPSRPKKAKGGIKAQNKKGSFGQTWWGRRWIEVVESLGMGSRLNRGKSYARSGQVLSIEVEKGKVTAEVQGSRAKPYKQSIKFDSLSKVDWKKLAGIFAGQAIFTAKLLAGEMPEEIEQAFQQAGLSLFPVRYSELQTNCSCPDYSDPCKHLAAVYYLLAEEFDRDPFLLFKLRGIERDELLALISKEMGAGKAGLGKTGALAGQAGMGATAPNPTASLQATPADQVSDALEQLPSDPAKFWQSGDKPANLPPAEVDVPTALVRQLGNFPFWRGKLGVGPVLEEVYTSAAAAGMELAAGGPSRERSE